MVIDSQFSAFMRYSYFFTSSEIPFVYLWLVG